MSKYFGEKLWKNIILISFISILLLLTYYVCTKYCPWMILKNDEKHTCCFFLLSIWSINNEARALNSLRVTNSNAEFMGKTWDWAIIRSLIIFRHIQSWSEPHYGIFEAICGIYIGGDTQTKTHKMGRRAGRARGCVMGCRCRLGWGG